MTNFCSKAIKHFISVAKYLNVRKPKSVYNLVWSKVDKDLLEINVRFFKNVDYKISEEKSLILSGTLTYIIIL